MAPASLETGIVEEYDVVDYPVCPPSSDFRKVCQDPPVVPLAFSPPVCSSLLILPELQNSFYSPKTSSVDELKRRRTQS